MIAVVAIVALVAVLVLLGRQRAQVRRANELLELSRELRHRYDALQAVTKEGVLVQSLAGRVLDISERAAAILGVDATTSVGRSVADLPVVLVNEHGPGDEPGSGPGPPDASRARRVDGRLRARRRRAARAPTRRRRAWCRWRASWCRPGTATPRRVLTTLVDVTGRREVEAALTRSEMQFRVAMENAPIGMALVDLEWRIVEANAAFAELLGTSVGALRGYRMEDLQHPGGPGRGARSRSTACSAAASTGSPSRSATSGPTATWCGSRSTPRSCAPRPARPTTSSSRSATRRSRGCRPRCSRTARCTTR